MSNALATTLGGLNRSAADRRRAEETELRRQALSEAIRVQPALCSEDAEVTYDFFLRYNERGSKRKGKR